MKKNKTHINNKKSLFSLFIVLFLALNFVNAQQDHVVASVTNIIFNLDGSVTPGFIFLDNTTNDDVQIDEIFSPDGAIFPTPLLLDYGTSVSLERAGKWCFILTRDPGGDDPCTIEICVVVNTCRQVRPRTGKNGDDPFDPSTGAVAIECDQPFDPTPPGGVIGENLTIPSNGIQEKIQASSKEYISSEKSNIDENSVIIRKIFPNPFKDELNIEIDGIEGKTLFITLYDVFGRLIKEKKYNTENGSQQLKLRIDENLSEGNYFIRIFDQTGFNYSQTLIHIN